MLQLIGDNFTTLFSYTGARILFALYVPAFVFLLCREKDRGKRYLFVYMPGVLLAVVLLLPLRTVYERLLRETDTYYRLFWLVPFAMTVCYAAVTALEKYRYAMFAVTAAAIMLGGSFVYNDAIITRAENRFHLSQVMLDVTNAIMEH
ncbi:MAG: hypothetical protein IJP92_05880, partial [Lachnospiraceae bacterium]|nr:hypothetical protein [Lachnospiraceae bacterium]